MKFELEHAFETLGVPVGAPASDVQSAYRRLIRAHHPDRIAGDTAAATQRLAEINAAKDLIDRTPKLPTRPIRADAPQSTADIRAKREAEARAQAEQDANEVVRSAAAHVSRHTPAHPTATAPRPDEDARRRRRQAAFEAAISGKAQTERPTLLGRIRSLAAR